MHEKLAIIKRDKHLLNFRDYEDYLESFITPRDLYHLRSKVLARQIIELGYHTEGVLDRDTFYMRVKRCERYLYLFGHPFALCSLSVVLRDNFLQELADREKANRYGEMYTIIFIRHSKTPTSQVSGFLDYNYRLRSEDWLPYFDTSKRLIPRKRDLSYFDWKSGVSLLNENFNFKPTATDKKGLMFQCLHDSKMIFVNPNLTSESDPVCTKIFSEMYGHVVLYDHLIVKNESDENEET